MVINTKVEEKTLKTQISTASAPKAIGPYSQAIEAGPYIFVSGQLPIDPGTGLMKEDIGEQTRQSIKNICAILSECGLTLANVVKTTVFMTDLSKFSDMNNVYAEYFSAPHPARSAVEVVRLPKNACVEIECIAVK